jgi:transposase
MKETVNNAAKKKERRKYDAEFKQQLLNLIANGQSVSEVSQTFGVGENLLHRWRRQGKAASKTQPVFPMEVEELRIKLKQVEMERDILKKALAIFSRQT